MQALCQDRFEQFNAANQASKIKIISLAEMASRYTSGYLNQTMSQLSNAAANTNLR